MIPLPEPSDRRLAVRITPDAMRQVRGGHRWVYDRSIESVSHKGAPGDLAVIFDKQRRFAAIGLWDPDSPIGIRILHTGKPTPIDRQFWRRALSESFARRQELTLDPLTTGYRLVHGENDGLPSLVLDRYGDVIVVKLYSAAWIPHLTIIVSLVVELLSPSSVVLRLARNVAAQSTHGLNDGHILAGDSLAGGVAYLENGLRFEVDPQVGQKTGAFLDQRENRALVGSHSSGCDVLDVFSYAGGFSVHAAAGGARSVHSVDQSHHAIAAAARHMTDNASSNEQVAAADHRTTAGDAFDVMDRLVATGSRYDLVVIDPPSFAQRQASLARALDAYRRLTELGIALTKPGGALFVSSCSSRVSADDFYANIGTTTRASGRRLSEIVRTAHPVDHPIDFAEGAYLKALLAQVE